MCGNCHVIESAHVWRALADPTRREILDLLRAGPRTTGAVCEAFPVTRFAVIRHLGVLAEAGLITVQRRGRERWNYVNAVPLRQELERWLTPFGARLAEATLALKSAVESAHPAPPEGDPSMSTQQQARLADGQIDVATEMEIAAPREKVFAAVADVARWWPHRFRGEATVVFEAHVGGRWFEDWGDGNGALYGTVGVLDRPGRLSITGPMGMAGPVTSVWSVQLEEAGPDRTIVRGSHRAFGDIDDDTAAAYSQGWTEVYDALVQHIGVVE
jgi:DNA-binding transcriptional ArsR family regulator/uncharacterized protein YndB with AHSA1/START domain